MFCPPDAAPNTAKDLRNVRTSRVPLTAEQRAKAGDPILELVTVLESGDGLVVASARSLLEDAGIPFWVLGDEIAPRILGLLPGTESRLDAITKPRR